MKFDWSIVATMAVTVTLGIAAGAALHLRGAELAIFIALLTLIGIAASAAIVYFKNRHKHAAAPAGGSAAAPAAGGDSEIDTLVREADQRLAHANAGATIANLPLIFVIGDRSTAKTSTVVNSGIEPELLAGQIYQDNMIAATRAANIWFARGTALLEAGGAVLGDPGNWLRLVKRLTPGKLKSLKGGAQSPRAVLLCVSLESFTQQGGVDAIAAAARYLQARLAEVAQTLGIRFPVYILFTKTDRVPFFTDFVNTFNNDEASQVFGVTVPMLAAQQTGVYAEDETRRLTAYFDNLWYSLCDKRTVFPPRDNDLEKICGAYEYPREMRKVRDLMVRFMVDVCRPSQLTTSPFLRGFYFSGVRPIVVSEAAPISASRPQQADYQGAASSGATGMFRIGKQAEMVAQQSVAQPAAATRKVPQWMFLGHLFNNIILSDTAAMSASGSSVKVSALRRGLLIAATVICLILTGLFTWSYFGNHALEKEAQTAAAAIPAKELAPGALPDLPQLQELESLRQTLQKLDGYETDGAPYKLRWGLYKGSDMYPEVQRLYFAKFRTLLFGQTKAGLLKVMQGVKAPAAETADYGYPYDTLKGYLLTTSEYKRSSEKSLQEFLGNLLLMRWSENRENAIGKDRMDLAKRQFDYYARVLSEGNPYTDKANDDAVKNARDYLASFKGPKRVYYAMLADAAKQRPSQSFNQWAEGSSATVLSAYPVAFAYTQKGAAYMLDRIKNAKWADEPWVVGPDFGKAGNDPEQMKKDVTTLYVQDYIGQWRKVLRTSHLVPYKDLRDAAAKLDTLTGTTAPILAVISWTSQNTAINDMPDVKDAFRAAQQVEPPGALAYVPSVQPYNDALQGLQSTISKAAEPNADPNTVKTAQDAADTARAATRRISSGLPPDHAGQVDAVVGALLMEPIIEADKKLRGVGADELNSAGGGFCSAFSPITRKFPFNPAAREEATLAEIAEVFRPVNSKLATFEDKLKKVIVCKGGVCTPVEPPPVQLNPAFRNFISQAAKLSFALYGDSGTDPNYHYTLTPQKSDQVDAFDVTVNGDTAKLSGGTGKAYIWPGSANPNFKLDLNLAGGTALGAQDRTGIWSLFHFFADADRTVANGSSYDFIWIYRAGAGGVAPKVAGRPLQYAFTVDANIFSKEFLAGMKCVPAVAK
ncbi:MAG TPA: ImcF-related family protein [Bryobacteraceae bacterium]|jgi:type VI secretion system protein ImpL